MSKRTYPTNPSVPTQSGYPPPGGGVMNSGYPPGGGGQNLNPYQNYTGQPGGAPVRSQPPPNPLIGTGGSSAYPRQIYPGTNQPMYPGPPTGSSQSWGAPPTNLSTPSGGYGSQGQPPSGVGQGSVYNYQQPPPPSSNAPPPPPPTNLSAGPPPPPSSGAVGGGMTMGLPPPGSAPGPSSHPQPTRISPAPPTSVATMATGVRQMQLGPPPTGAPEHKPLPQMTSMTSGTRSYPQPPGTGQTLGAGQQPLPPPPTSSGQLPQGPSATTSSLPPAPGQPPSLGSQLSSSSSVGQPPSLGRQPPPPPSLSGQPPSLGGQPPPPTSLSGQPPSSSSGPTPQMFGGHRYPPPPSSGIGQTPPPPPTAGTVSAGLGPPPIAGQPYAPSVGQAPPTGGLQAPPTSGLAPPPKAGQPYVPSANVLGQAPPTFGQAPPTALGKPPPTTGPGGTGSLSTGPPGPGGVGVGSSGPRPAMGLGPGSRGQPGGAPPPTPPFSQPGGIAQSDPNLQPVNILESRSIIPSTPVVPPLPSLPNNLTRFTPNHKVFCSTMNAVPATNGLLNKLKLPFAIHIHPFKDMTSNDCPIIHPTVIVRCRMCRAYINPYVTFIDSRHWRCNLCFRPNTLPEDFDYNPHSGRHGDRSHRVELKRSSVEYIAPSEYMVRPPQPCVFYFLIDVSFNAVQSGLLEVFCKCLLENLERLPGDARTMVGVLTYDSSLHFYNLNSDLSQPQMLIVSDIDDVFLPCPDSLLVTLKDSKELIRNLLEDLPRMFAENKSVHSALGAALQAATKLLHPIGGRITVLQTSIPNIGPGALKYRDVTPSATKMDTLSMSPASDFYKKLALDCSSQQIAVDLFAFGGQFMDLSTIACISKFSSGQVLYYPEFHQKRQVPREKFEKDFKRYLTRKIGFEAVMRIRCTDGLSLHTFHGNFFVRSTDLLSLPNVNPDHGFTMNIAIDESLKEISMVCFQAALLYTSSRGERRIRVHSLSVPVSNQLSDIYSKLNVLAITGVLANMAVDRATSSSLGDAREALMNLVIDGTKMYRSNFASSMQASQFTLPATLRLLPIFMTALLKNPAFSLNSKVSYDFRSHAMNLIKSTPLDYILCWIYPRLYALHMLTDKCVMEREDGKEELTPPILQLSSEKMTRYGIFLMDYGLGMYIWVAKDAPQALIQKIFGVPHFGAIPEIMTSLPQEENDIGPLVNKLIKQIRASRQIHVPLQVIREDGPHRLQFIEKMVDDRTDYGTSYYEFLTHVSRQLSK